MRAKKSIKCVMCPSDAPRFRTRKEHLIRAKMCEKCLFRAAMKANPSLAHSGSSRLDLDVMSERWFHELIYRQVDANGLVGLGLGVLEFFDDKQRNEQTMGQFTISCNARQHRLDLLLRARSKRAVCVEVKRRADDNTIAQVIRYLTVLDREGFDDPIAVIVTCSVTPQFLDSIEYLWNNGTSLKVFQLKVEGDHIKLCEVKHRGKGRE